MLLLPKRTIYLIILLCFIVLLFFTIQFYSIIIRINTANDLLIKYYAENFIYFFIIITLIINIFLVRIITRSRNIFKDLDKIIDLSQYGNYNCQDQLKKMGILGEKINYILFQLVDLNLKESLKISSLSNINEFLMESIPLNIMILNSQGNIIKASKQLENYFSTEIKYIINRNIGDLISGIDFNGIILNLEKEHIALQTKDSISLEGKNKICKILWQPITNNAHKISHVIAVMEP